MRRWHRAVTGSVLLALGLRGLALTQSGCGFRIADGRWRDTLRARPENRHEALEGSPARWLRRGATPAPYRQLSDLASTPRGLVATASIDALTVDGAALVRFGAAAPETLMTWAGQGFLRVHAYDNVLLVPDADAPFRLLPFVFDLDVDGYVFVSDLEGRVRPERRAVLPAVYHVFDTARLANGRVVASTGAYPPGAIAYLSDAAPAALFVDPGGDGPWVRGVAYPTREARGVWRLTYLAALPNGELVAGTETPRGPGAVWIHDPAGSPTLGESEGLSGGYVLRWYLDGETLWAVCQGFSTQTLWRSRDAGRRFEAVAAPADVQNLVRADGALYLLAGGALYRASPGAQWSQVVPPIEALRPTPSSLVSAPLLVHRGRIWAGSPTTGEVFEAAP